MLGRGEVWRIVAVSLLGAALRLAYVDCVPQKAVVNDAAGFRALGRSLAEHGHLGGAVYRGPVYPAFLGAIYSCGGEDQSVRRVQALVGGVTVALCGVLGWLLGGPRCLTGSALICAFHPALIAFTGLLLSENLYALLLVCVALAAAWVGGPHESERRLRPVVLGAVLAVCSLCRPEALVFPVVLFAAALFVRRSSVALKALAGRWVVALGVMVVLIAPWTARNYVVTGSFVPIATGAGVLWLGSTSLGWTHWHYEREPLRSMIRGLSEVERDRVLVREGVHSIVTQPRVYAKRCARRLRVLLLGEVSEAVRLWDLPTRAAAVAGRRDVLVAKACFVLTDLLLYLGMVVCAIRRSPNPSARAMSAAIVTSLLVVYVLTYATARYRVSLTPLMVSLGCCGLTQAGRPLNRRVGRRGSPRREPLG